MQEDVLLGFRGVNRVTVDPDVVGVGIGQSSRLADDDAVDRDPSLDDEAVSSAARRQSRPGQNLVQSELGHP